MKNDDLERQLTQLGREWSTDESFVERVMSRLDEHPPNANTPDQTTLTGRRLMRLSYCTAAVVLVCVGLWWAFGPQSTGSALYAQIQEAMKQVRTFHQVVSVRADDGELRQTAETWFARGKGFAVFNPEVIRIDNGTYFWEHRKGSERAARSTSQGTDDLLDQSLNIREELKRHCERYRAGDRETDGTDLRCYRLTYHGTARPADPAVVDSDKRRTFIFVDSRSLPRLVESQEKLDGQWRARVVRTWEYDVPVDASLFEPRFGEHVRVIDTDKAFEQLTAVHHSVHTEERDGLIYTIHQAKRFEDGGVFIMSSVRGTEATLKKYPLKRRMLQPGRYVTDYPAMNYNASPQGNRYFRLQLARASHKGVHVEWWMMVPRGQKPDWFEDYDGRVQLRLGITPRGEYGKENHADERGVINHITWDLALDIPKPETLPSLGEIAEHVYADLEMLNSVFPRRLHMGIKTVDGESQQQSASTDDVSPEQFAAAAREHVLWWERNDVEWQLKDGGVSVRDEHGEYVIKPAVFVDYNSAVSDATLGRANERADLVRLSARGTQVTDAGLALLKGLHALNELNIAETSITDEGLRHLEGLASLRKLNVEGTRVTQAGIDRLQKALPDLEITASNLGN